LPEDTLCYRLEGSSSEVITKLLKARYRRLSNSDADRIAEFSHGNARVAFALASTVEKGGELSSLRNRELFERLFQQKNDPNDELLRCAEAASLLYSFDGEDVSSSGEIARVAGFSEVTSLTFLRHMAELERRGLLQRRRQWRAVLPHAIANGLAKRILESVPKDLLYADLIEKGGDRIARSFTRRLGFLHDCPEAVAMASRMFASSGTLGKLTELSDLECQMFANLAPVDPKGALEAIKRAVEKEDFLSTDNRVRARFARIARSIAYEPEYFDDAVMILKQFALAEPVGYKNDPSRDILKSLFFCLLSGTQASPDQRHKVVEDIFSRGEEKERELGFDLIRAGLKTWDFVSHYGFEFGARRRDYGWQPRSQADLKAWFGPWIEIAATIGVQDNEYGRKARTIIGEAWRGLWGKLGLDDELVDVARRLSAIDGWPEGWLGVRQVLQWDAKSLTPTSLAQLKELEKSLAPSDLVSEIRARVLVRGILDYDIEEETTHEDEKKKLLSASEKYRRAQMKTEELGAKAANSPELLDALIADLCSNGFSNAYAFGRGIGRHHADMTGLLRVVRNYIKRTDGKDLNLIWVRGLIAGWKETDPEGLETFLNDAIDDAVWRIWFVELQVQAGLDAQSFDRLLRVLDSAQCPTYQFRYLATGRATDPLDVSQIMAIANKLALRPDHGLPTAIDLLAMVIHCANEKDEQYKSELGQALREFLGCMNWSLLYADRAQIDHDLGMILEFVLRSAGAEDQVTPILRSILITEKTDQVRYSDMRKIALKPFFKYFPRLTLEMVCVPDEDGTFEQAKELVFDPYSELEETALGIVPTDVLVDWCNEKPDKRYVFAAGACKLFEKQDDEKMPLKVADTAITLLEAAPDKMAVVNEFVLRFYPSSWAGSLADTLEKRLPLLDQLAISGDETIKLAIASAKTKLQNGIDAERAREKEEEKSRISSFE